MTFSDATLSFDYPPAAFLMMGLNGVFAVLATIGGIMFIVVVVGSVLVGKPRDEEMAKTAPIIFQGGGATISGHGGEATLKLPGTVTLVTVFFISFVLYYFVNWKFLSEVWPLS